MLTFIKTLFKAHSAPPPKKFIDVLDEFVELMLKEQAFSDGTEKRYRTQLNNSRMFLVEEKLLQLLITDLRPIHAERFRAWLKRNLRTCTITYASRHAELWKRVSRYAFEMQYTVTDYLIIVPRQRDKPKRPVTLTVDEIKRLMAVNFQKEVYNITRDLFLFQCFTGLSYCDIFRFKIDHGKWIYGERQKSGREFENRFFDDAKEILKKYQGNMPRLSNQKYNEYLKEVGSWAGINKHLTTHIGRKTHGTLLAEMGASDSVVSYVLGNTEKESRTTYINRTKQLVQREFERVGIGQRLITN